MRRFRTWRDGWDYLQHHWVGKTVVTGNDDLKRKVVGILRFLQNLPVDIHTLLQEQFVC